MSDNDYPEQVLVHNIPTEAELSAFETGRQAGWNAAITKASQVINKMAQDRNRSDVNVTKAISAIFNEAKP